MEIEVIKKYCIQIRNVIEENKSDIALFEHFPAGSCEHSSLIVGRFLEEKGFKNLKLCRSEWRYNDCWLHHTWLEYSSYIIDITADQFGPEYDAIIVKDNCLRDRAHELSTFEVFSFFISNSIDELNQLNSMYERVQHNKLL